MYRIGLLALAIVLPARAQTAAQQPSEVFAGLAGSCWKSQMTPKETDTHCFRLAVGGRMLADTNTVRDEAGKTVYEGVAIYRLDKASGAVRYDYYNSPGGHYVGYGRRVGDEIRFAAKPDAKEPDIVWKLKGDSYDSIPASEEKGHAGHFVKIGPAD
jgi:hypothetical protein